MFKSIYRNQIRLWFEKAVKALAMRQIDTDVISGDILNDRSKCSADNGKLIVKGESGKVLESYSAIVVTECEYMPEETLESLQMLADNGVRVVFVNKLPEKAYFAGKAELQGCSVCSTEGLADELADLRDIRVIENTNDLVYYHYIKEGGVHAYFIVNQSTFNGGTYEIEKPYLVETSPSSANVPGLYGGDVNTDNAAVVTSTDGTFTGEREISVRIGNYLRNQLNYPGNQPDKVLSDLRDYCTTEKLKDVHPDAPDNLKNLERYVFTTHLTVEALHPVKNDLVVAKAVLEIRWVSRWLTDSLYPALTEAGVTDFPHAEVTVLSYEQSDSFGEE